MTNRKAKMPTTLDLDHDDPVSCLKQEQLDKLDKAIPLAERLLKEMHGSTFASDGQTFNGLDEEHRKLLKELLNFAELNYPIFEAMKLDPAVKKKHDELRNFLASTERILDKIEASVAGVKASLGPLQNSKSHDIVEKTVSTIVNLFDQDQTLLPLVSDRVAGLSTNLSTETRQLEDAVRSVSANLSSARTQCGSMQSTLQDILQKASQVVTIVQQVQNESQRNLAEHQKNVAAIVEIDKKCQLAFTAHEATLNRVQQQAQADKSRLEKLQTLLSQSTAREKSTATDLSDRTKQMRNMDDERKALAADCSSKASMIEGLKANVRDLATTTSSLAQARHEIIELQNAERTLNQEVAGLKGNVQQLEHKRHDDVAEYNNLHSSLVDLNSDHNKLLSDHELLEEAQRELQGDKEELQEEKSRLLSELKESNDQLRELHETNRELKHAQVDADESIHSLTANKQQLEQDINAAHRERDVLADDVQKLREQIAAGDKDRAALNDRLLKEQSSTASQEKIISNLQSKVQSLDEESGQHYASFQKCQEEVNWSTDKLQRVQKDHHNLEAKYNSLRSLYDKSAKSVLRQQNLLDTAGVARRQVSAQLQEAEEGIVQLRNSIDDLSKNNQQQSTALQEKETALQSTSVVAQEAKQQVERLDCDLKQSRASVVSLQETIQELSPFRTRHEDCLAELKACQINCEELDSRLKPMASYQATAERLPFYRGLMHDIVAPSLDQAVLSLIESSWPRIGATCNRLRSQEIDTHSFVMSFIHGVDQDGEDGCHDLLQSSCNLVLQSVHPRCNFRAADIQEIAQQLRLESGYMVRMTIAFMLCFLDRLRHQVEGHQRFLSSETSLVALRVFELVASLVRDPEILGQLSQNFSDIVDILNIQGLISTSLFQVVRRRLDGDQTILAKILPNLSDVQFAKKADLIMALDGLDLVVVRSQQDVALIPSENFDLFIDVERGWQIVFDQDAPLLAGSRTPFWAFTENVEEFRAVFGEILARKDMEESW